MMAKLKQSVLNKNLILFFFLLSLFHYSCQSRRKIPYFRDIGDSTRIKSTSQYTPPTIQPDDILSIIIQTIDPQNATVLNQITSPIPAVGTSSANSIGNQVVYGFLVDKDGFIDLPMMGKINLRGLTTFKAKDLVKEKAAQYFKNPIVQVRFANYKITILGEVSKPATYTLPNEKVSILDAIGLAGDLTIYGRRDNVMLIRESGEEKEFVRFNLNSSEIFHSPYFYLKQNDIIYIEPNKSKIISSNAYRTRNVTLIATAISLIILLMYRVDF
jgi:polysaccharide biosynthesis/export protein